MIDRRGTLGLLAGTGSLAVAPALATPRARGLAAKGLRCEWLDTPMGVDVLRPRFHWELEGGASRGEKPKAVRVIVASSAEALAARRGDVWDSGALHDPLHRAQPGRALKLVSHRQYHWAVAVTDPDGDTRWSLAARFGTGLLNPAEWQAKWIAAGAEFPPRPPHVRGQDKHPPDDPRQSVLPLMRRGFALDALPVRATVSMAGLGHGTLSLNGQRATDALFEPGWTEYARTILYTTYDVTALLRPGANMLGVMLGNGMFNSERKQDRKSKFVETYGRPRLILQLSLDFADGSRRTIVSDEHWQVREGPILFSSIFGGEDVDARHAVAGWDMPGTADAGWRAAAPIAAPKGKLRSQAIPPVRRHQVFDTAKVTEPKPGVFVHDLGTNFAGRPVLKLRGPAGATVKMIPAEVLGEDGLYWQRSFNAGPGRMVEYNFTLAGTGAVESFVPEFNYHGFRYLQIEGAAPPGKAAAGVPEIVQVAGEFLYADLPETGSFDCSKKLFVDTHKLIERAVLSNAYSVLTDCPHREKLGWLEQTHLNASTVFYNRDAVTLYEKLSIDITDSQRPSDGMVPGIAPEYMHFLKPDGSDDDPRSSPEWGAAVMLAPWASYRFYGDTRALVDGYPAMQRYLGYLEKMATDGIVDFGLGDWYDVGPGKLGASQLTSRALTGTATWYQALDTMARIARLLGRPAGEAAGYAKRAGEIRDGFNRRFFNAATGSYDRGSQTANSMPLTLGMVPKGREADVLAALVRAVRESDNAMTAGDIGFHYVVRALTEQGRDDVLFDMMSVTDRPSYGYQLAQGATALAEAWSADPTKSLNHFMLGHGEFWLYGALAGIRVDFAETPHRILTIAPRPVGDVTHASATLRTVLGPVRSAWRRQGSVLELEADVPPGATATVILPSAAPARVTENGRPLAGAEGVIATKPVPGAIELTLTSGRYRFATPFGAA